MIKVLKGIYVAIGLLSIGHIGIGFVAAPENEVARLWFVGAGLAVMFVSALGLSGIHRLQIDHVISSNWLGSNLLGALFVGYACRLLPEAQNFLLFVLMALSVALALKIGHAEIRSGRASVCCIELNRRRSR